MKKATAILLFIFIALFAIGQTSFKTIVPQKPVVLGEAFQVQYVLDNGREAKEFIAPPFSGFKIVAGPYIYSGKANLPTNERLSKNFVFTLVALNPGRQLVPGAFISVNDKKLKSNDGFVEVSSKEDAMKRFEKEMGSSSNYYLPPGENVQEKIRQNLFMKVLVDKKSCIVGEPVVATYKLYSRLESKSDIVKNPGFYGFSVLDMINLSDRFVTTEEVNGKTFDVHTIRKVQLYPLQAGVFTVDAMEIINKVEFSRSNIIRKTEQEIVEGVLSNKEVEESAGVEIFEYEIKTKPISVLVKPIPVKVQAADFTGAVGVFSIAATFLNEQLAAGEQGVLEISISGQGNFIQLNAPAINWPPGVEGFDPVIKDSLDIYAAPLKGKRKFRYAFVVAAAGTYTIPPIGITFFNRDTGAYTTASTKPLQLTIGEKKRSVISRESFKKVSAKYGLPVVAILIGIAGIAVWMLVKRKKAVVKQPTPPLIQVATSDDFLKNVQFHTGEKDFYTTLYQSIWSFYVHHYNLSGTEVNKENLFYLMKESGVNQILIEQTATILQQCEAGMYTGATITGNKEELFTNAKKILEQVQSSLF